MRLCRRWVFWSLVLVLVLCWAAGTGAQQPRRGEQEAIEFPVVDVERVEPRAEYAEGELLVRPRIEPFPSKARVEAVTQTVEALTRSLGARTAEVIKLHNEVPIYRVKLDPSRGISVEEAIAYYEKDPSIEYAEPNWKRYAYQESEPPVNDPGFQYMWGLHNTGQEIIPDSGIAGIPDADIDAPEAWQVFDSSEPVIVAVIDTGIQYYHPDLKDNMWVNPGEIPDDGIDNDGNGFVDDVYGWDFFWNDNTVYDVTDKESHGTHTAGTIAAVGNNGIGVVGVAWKANVRIMALKFLGPGGGYDSDAIKAFNYAAQMGATLTSNSWGGGGYGKALREAIEASGMLAICAAGNSASDNDAIPHYPSSYVSENIIAVAASDWNDEMASFSCWGEESVDIAAPGHWILSTYPNKADYSLSGYAWAGGTSMATPHVAGVAALLAAARPDVPQYAGAEGWQEGTVTIKDMILNSSDVRPAFVGKVLTGGRLNAYNALMGIWPPAIHEVRADKTYGSPGETGLTVTFSGSASSRLGMRDATPIADQWWDFGDGSAPVHAATATHTYTEEGCYTATFHVVDDLGNEARAIVGVVVANPDTVLFVDDDEGTDYDVFFTAALAAAGKPYVTVTPSIVVTLPSDIPNPIIWNCGEAYSGTLLAADQTFLSRYLDNGGRLFLSGYDILYDLVAYGNGLDFVARYLHIDTSGAGLDLLDYCGTGVTQVTGKTGDLISDGMDIALSYPGSYNNTYVDGVIPTGGAVGIFDGPPAAEGGSPVCVGLRYADSAYRVVFLGFPFEAVPADAPDPNNSAVLMERILRFLTAEDTGENLLPVITSISADIQIGVAPLEVAFAGSAYDAEGDIAAQWDFGDGTPPVDGATAKHVYAEPGIYTATLTVTDTAGASVSQSLTIVAVESPETVLFVDGDFSLGTTPMYVEPVMSQAGIPYVSLRAGDIMDHGSVAPGAEQFVMFWNCGLLDYPTPDQVAALKQYLKNGGRLFVAGQELIYGVGMNFSNPDDFVIKYLHVGDANSDVCSEAGDVFTGVEGDPITDGLSFEVDFEARGLPVEANWIDEIYPDGDAIGIFTAPDNTFRALRYGGDGYKVVFLAFPLEVVPTLSQAPGGLSRQETGTEDVAVTLVSRAYEWLLVNETPVVTVSVPENAVCAAGRGVDIRWTAHDPDGLDRQLTIRLDYSLDGGATWTLIAEGEPNDGSYVWDGKGVKKGGKALIRVSATDPQGATGSATSGEITLVVGSNMLLAGPNPASTRVTFYYNIPENGTLFVYDIAGRLVYSVNLSAGSNAVVWSLVDGEGRDLANGLYIAILVTDRGLKSDPVRLIIRR